MNDAFHVREGEEVGFKGVLTRKGSVPFPGSSYRAAYLVVALEDGSFAGISQCDGQLTERSFVASSYATLDFSGDSADDVEEEITEYYGTL